MASTPPTEDPFAFPRRTFETLPDFRYVSRLARGPSTHLVDSVQWNAIRRIPEARASPSTCVNAPEKRFEAAQSFYSAVMLYDSTKDEQFFAQ
jgi:hypothetical protein